MVQGVCILVLVQSVRGFIWYKGCDGQILTLYHTSSLTVAMYKGLYCSHTVSYYTSYRSPD